MNMIRNKNKGFTLIELMIVLVIISLLLAYAVPTYRQYVLKAHRSEAQNALLQLASLQERHYANNNRYGTAAEVNLAAAYPAATAANGLHYTITLVSTNTSYTISAAAFGKQNDDTGCTAYSIDNLGAKLPVAGDCW